MIQFGLLMNKVTHIFLAILQEIMDHGFLMKQPQLCLTSVGFHISNAREIVLLITGATDYDVEKLQTMMVNLLSNAIKFTHTKDRASVEVSGSQCAAATIMAGSTHSRSAIPPSGVFQSARHPGCRSRSASIAPEMMTPSGIAQAPSIMAWESFEIFGD